MSAVVRRRTLIAFLFMLLLVAAAAPTVALTDVSIDLITVQKETHNPVCEVDGGFSFVTEFEAIPDGIDTIVGDSSVATFNGISAYFNGNSATDVFFVFLGDGSGFVLESVPFVAPSGSSPQTFPLSLNLLREDPLYRPFYIYFYDVEGEIPFAVVNSPNEESSIQYVIDNGTEVATFSFDPATLVDDCADLPFFETDTPETPVPPPPSAVASACPNIPAGSVVGDLPLATRAYYAPGELSTVTLNPGTYWVLGVDASAAYYKIALACQFLWVPVETMQPSFLPPQNGAPLPTRVVN